MVAALPAPTIPMRLPGKEEILPTRHIPWARRNRTLWASSTCAATSSNGAGIGMPGTTIPALPWRIPEAMLPLEMSSSGGWKWKRHGEEGHGANLLQT
jgi:hypothetical protein